jgi:hypothetical protein
MSSKIDNICNDLFHAGKITIAEWTVISQSVQDYSHGEIIRTTGEAKLSLLADEDDTELEADADALARAEEERFVRERAEERAELLLNGVVGASKLPTEYMVKVAHHATDGVRIDYPGNFFEIANFPSDEDE